MDTSTIIQHQRAALELYVRNRSVAFCFEYASDDIEGGSAVCIDIEDRLFVATAAHNFDRFSEKPNWSAFSANRSSDTRLTILGANYRVGRPQDEPDVAWLEIEPTSARESDLVGIDIEGLLLNPLLQPGELYVVTGFPRDLKRVSKEQDGHRTIVMPLGFYFTTVVDAHIASAGGGLLVLDYQKAGIDISGQAVEVEPYGMSGGGVWYSPEGGAGTGVWDPGRLKLLGLNRKYYRSKRQLTAEPMHTWLTLVRDDLPELRSAIDPLLEAH